jgi:outer membrane protein assembly factor BamD
MRHEDEMQINPKTIGYLAVVAVLTILSTSCRRKIYENPITKDTQQPDKVLFDKAVGDMEHGRYEIARLTLQTLINTYDNSEYLAKAKLAIADSWYREGNANGLAQAEAEYKDFILFYPTMEESAEAQEKICTIHYRQMDKADRDNEQTMRANEECRQLVQQFPNSKYAPEAEQKLREIQEVLASGEFTTGVFYMKKGSYPAAANRLQALTDQFPLFSQADDALWDLAQSYEHMGDRFESQAGVAYAKIVRDYPLSAHVGEATDKLKAMNMPVPEADPVAYARMKYELENRQKASIPSRVLAPFSKSPDVRAAAKSGSPIMANFKPGKPLSVPEPPPTGGTPAGSVSDVSATTVSDSSTLDRSPDARANPAAQNNVTASTEPNAGAQAAPASASQPNAGAQAAPANTPAAQTEAAQPLPTNHTAKPKKVKKPKKNQKPAQTQQQAVQQTQPTQQTQQPAAAGAPAGGGTTAQPAQ